MDKNFRFSDEAANARVGASELDASEADLGTRMAAAKPLGARQ
jgi:hypothetical protein